MLEKREGAGHYFSPSPRSESRPRLIRHSASGAALCFMTDNGVFSKGGVDFGSDLLIRSLPALSGRVLDMCCGYGAIGISLKCLNPGIELHMADINERAIGLCRMNFELNCRGEPCALAGMAGCGRDGAASVAGVSAAPGIACATAVAGASAEAGAAGGANVIALSDGFERLSGKYDCIVMNPPIRAGKRNVFRLYRDSSLFLKPGGSLFVVMRKKHGLESSCGELRRLFGNCADVARKAGYHVLRAVKNEAEGD
ncbi:MAG: methyltransferase [Clostridiales bacterium]|jgi:16S rRNA (guanine1207-N2)-methyltransferase|nr:methyltransferase [Clostridiales bacterium]